MATLLLTLTNRRRHYFSSLRFLSLAAAVLVSKPVRTSAFLIRPRSSTTTTTRSFATTTASTQLNMAPKVLVPIGDGSEEIETTCITDTLTRFGAKVTVASVMPSGLVCTMSRGIKIMADVSIDDAAKEEWDLVALPGGMPGATHLKESAALTKILNQQKDANKLYGAVCASPAVVLASQNLLPSGGAATCYPAPGFRDTLQKAAQVSNDKVIVHEKVVTSQGPGTSLLFALALGEQLFGKDKRDEIAQQMLVE